jgi:hypothetical protein
MLTAFAEAGSILLAVADTTGFAIGSTIVINPDGATQEFNEVADSGPIISGAGGGPQIFLSEPLLHNHQAGEVVAVVSGPTPTATPTRTSTAVASGTASTAVPTLTRTNTPAGPTLTPTPTPDTGGTSTPTPTPTSDASTTPTATPTPAGEVECTTLPGGNGTTCFVLDLDPATPGDQQARHVPSGSFTVDIYARDIPAANGGIGGVFVVLAYDASLLAAATPETVLGTPYDCDAGADFDENPGTGDAFFGCFSLSGGVSGDVLLGSVTFTVAGSGISAITFTESELFDPEGIEFVSCNPVFENAGGGCHGGFVTTGDGAVTATATPTSTRTPTPTGAGGTPSPTGVGGTGTPTPTRTPTHTSTPTPSGTQPAGSATITLPSTG